MEETPASSDGRRPVVLLLSQSAQLAGAEILMARLSGGLRRLVPFVVLGEHGPIEHELRVRGVEYLVVPFPSSSARSRGRRAARLPLDMLRSLRALCAVVGRRRPDVIYTHSAQAHVLGGLVGLLRNVPVVQHQHVVLDRGLLSRPAIAIYRVCAAVLADGIIGNSRASLASIGAWRLGKPGFVIRPPLPYPPVDRPVVRPTVTRFVLAGRISEQKGQDIAVRAFAAARHALAPDARLHIVGDALFARDQSFKAALRALIDELDLGDAVVMHGARSDMDAVIAEADVCLHTARWPEGFGMVVAEAMAAGTPVIASRLGGPAEIVSDGINGLLVEPDVDAIATALVSVAESIGLRARLAVAGLQTARRLTTPRIVAATENALLRLIRRRS
ncbi:hypothetical protein LLS1_24490 [Leifsonia sp. LS1]|uniref:glycosyltransferase n=1 Tax=Leifsonia sp. LS1 TaxID=2828483 RepID=UPI001CFF1D4D|nr:glycosyltransferase [Leifsonia sp. LS1]GIT80780.1 hypothetical protein LLS1_24490 [Leifsonia sp. LS1]